MHPLRDGRHSIVNAQGAVHNWRPCEILSRTRTFGLTSVNAGPTFSPFNLAMKPRFDASTSATGHHWADGSDSMRFDGQALPNRSVAGRCLAERLKRMQLPQPVVLALPRGGVPVAVEIARELDAPIDLLLVRKIGVPWQPELAAAAIVDGANPDIVLNENVITETGISQAALRQLADGEWNELERRRKAYLAGRPPVEVYGRSVVLVDDGIATGASVSAALTALGRRDAARLVLAVPVAPEEVLQELSPLVDQIVCLATPKPFYGVGEHYDDFHQLSDEEVIAMLRAIEGCDRAEQHGNDDGESCGGLR